MPVIPVNRVVDTKRIIGQIWRAEEEKRHKVSKTTLRSRRASPQRTFLKKLS
jgi:hypothetical protein